MLQKELAKRLKARYDAKMDGNEWLEVSSDGIPLCRIKYNGQFLSNADQNLSDEYRSKIADIQDEISTVREYVGLYEHAPQLSVPTVKPVSSAALLLGKASGCFAHCLVMYSRSFFASSCDSTTVGVGGLFLCAVNRPCRSTKRSGWSVISCRRASTSHIRKEYRCVLLPLSS